MEKSNTTKMIFIAHRGLMHGPDKKLENTPAQIKKSIIAGFEVEVDVWYISGKLWLGHDGPEYEMPQEYLYNHMLGHFWFHCKDMASYEFFCNYDYASDTNFFWHQADDYVRTSKGWTWVYPGKDIPKGNSICVLPEYGTGPLSVFSTFAKGVCTDYPVNYKKLYKSG